MGEAIKGSGVTGIGPTGELNQPTHLPSDHREPSRMLGRSITIVSFPGHRSMQDGPQSQPRAGIRFDIDSLKAS